MLLVLEEGYFTVNGFINSSSFMAIIYAALCQLIALCSRAIWVRYSFVFPSRGIVLRHYWVPLKTGSDIFPTNSSKCWPCAINVPHDMHTPQKSSFGLAIACTHLHKYHTDFLCFEKCIGKKKKKKEVWLVT